MNHNFTQKARFVRIKPRFYLFICSIAFVILSLGACNSKSTGDTTTHDDTSSTVTDKVDTAATDSGTKQR